MNKALIAVLGILVILGGLGFYLYSERANVVSEQNHVSENFPAPLATQELTSETSGTEESSPSASGTDALKPGGSSYLDANGVYNFLYPSDFRLDTQDPKHIRIFKTGPTQKGQTEMYDGAMMVFETISLGNQNLEQWVDNYIKTGTADGTLEIIEPKKKFVVNNYPGFAFKMRGLGESQYYILQKDAASKNGVMITTAVYDPTNAGFQKQVDSTLTTLQLLK